MAKISEIVSTLKRSKKVNNRRGSALALGGLAEEELDYEGG